MSFTGGTTIGEGDDGKKRHSQPSRPSRDTLARIEAVAAAGREVRRSRSEALSKMKGGLRVLNRTLELPGTNPLKDAHAALDIAVYGFNAKKDLARPTLRPEPTRSPQKSRKAHPSPLPACRRVIPIQRNW